MTSEFTINLPFCFHVPDDEYSIRLSDNDIITLRLTKIVPESYDERMGFRGLIKNDLDGISKVALTNLDQSPDGTYKSQLVKVDELERITDFCLVARFEDDDGKQYSPGSSPSDNNLSTNMILPSVQIYLNGEIEKDKLGRLRYSRITYLDTGSGYPLDKFCLQ